MKGKLIQLAWTTGQLRTDLKTRKQRNKNSIKNIIVFLLKNLFWANRKGESKLYFFLLVVIKLFLKKTKIFLTKFSFRCFLNPFPGQLDKILLENYWTFVIANHLGKVSKKSKSCGPVRNILSPPPPYGKKKFLIILFFLN